MSEISMSASVGLRPQIPVCSPLTQLLAAKEFKYFGKTLIRTGEKRRVRQGEFFLIPVEWESVYRGLGRIETDPVLVSSAGDVGYEVEILREVASAEEKEVIHAR